LGEKKNQADPVFSYHSIFISPDSVSSVFDSLLASDVHAIPLFDHDNQAPVGIVDVFDVLAYTVDKCKLTDMEKLHSTLEGT
jgi:CBS domain containing-hemolysin-like protein